MPAEDLQEPDWSCSLSSWLARSNALIPIGEPMSSEVYSLLELAAKKFDSFQVLWSFYITVVLGFLAYLAAAPNSSRSEVVRVILVVAFSGFAFVNYHGLKGIRAERAELAEAANIVLAAQPDSPAKGHL